MPTESEQAADLAKGIYALCAGYDLTVIYSALAMVTGVVIEEESESECVCERMEAIEEVAQHTFEMQREARESEEA